MKIEDLRLPCKYDFHCDGGRVPTRQELIGALDGCEFVSLFDDDTQSYGHPMEIGDWFWKVGKGERHLRFAVVALGGST